MYRKGHIAVIPLVLGVMVAGCGGTSKSTTAKSAQSGGGSTAAASPASSAASGSYGSTSSNLSASPAALITTKSDKLGTILAYGPKRLTVYLFEGDRGSTSSCTGACASVWPPVVGKPQVAGGASSADLGTVKRPDGTLQVTYNGHPLYLFAKDKDAGDTYGQGVHGFGADWYVLKPSGEKVDSS